jgi:hypothetical protein
VIGQLAANFPGSTWDQIPKGCFNYGGGGVNSWGSICGGANAGSALLAQLGAPTVVKDEFLAWYERNAFPNNDAYLDYASGTWTPGGSATGGWGIASNQLAIPGNGAPRSKAHSILCHASWTEWFKAAGGETGNWVATTYAGNSSNAASDRCAKLVYDCVFMLANLINDWKATPSVLPTGALDSSAQATGCMNPSCHVQSPAAAFESRGKTACVDSCHK